jgi:hypothetical protein
MNSLIVRSRRKLNEADFFLRRLSQTEGVQPAFGFHLSALLSALRSVGLVLQADLRGPFGEEFDSWWKAAKTGLPATRVPFSVLVELRNQALKEGEVLPGMAVVVRIDHPRIEEATFIVDLRKGQITITSEHYKFRPGGGPTLKLHNPEDSDEMDQEFFRILPELRDILQSLNTNEASFDIGSIGYLVERDGLAVPFSELVLGCSEHIEAMRVVLDEAEKRFIPAGE